MPCVHEGKERLGGNLGPFGYAARVSFTTAEQAQVLRYLGFANWMALAQSIQLGFPASSQPLFLVRDAFNRISPDGEADTRLALCNLCDIDAQISQARKRFATEAVGEIKFREGEIEMLWREYGRWQRRLADSLGVDINAYSTLSGSGSLGGINARVTG